LGTSFEKNSAAQVGLRPASVFPLSIASLFIWPNGCTTSPHDFSGYLLVLILLSRAGTLFFSEHARAGEEVCRRVFSAGECWIRLGLKLQSLRVPRLSAGRSNLLVFKRLLRCAPLAMTLPITPKRVSQQESALSSLARRHIFCLNAEHVCFLWKNSVAPLPHHKGTKDTKKNPTGLAFVNFVPLWCRKIFAVMPALSQAPGIVFSG
jgi:hypothetical protein